MYFALALNVWISCTRSSLMFPLSRHLNGSDMSSTSFWLRVALGSAVAAVLGFAVYRAVARLKWWTANQAPLFSSALPSSLKWLKADSSSSSSSGLLGKPSTHHGHKLHPALWVAWLQQFKEQWEAADHIDTATSSVLCLIHCARPSGKPKEPLVSRQVLLSEGTGAGTLLIITDVSLLRF